MTNLFERRVQAMPDAKLLDECLKMARLMETGVLSAQEKEMSRIIFQEAKDRASFDMDKNILDAALRVLEVL